MSDKEFNSLRAYAIINFKGGVGKTTITWLLGQYLNEYYSKKVLLIDLDPQMSLTLGLYLKEDGFLEKDYQKWHKERIQKKETIYHLMESYYNNKKKFIHLDLSKYIYEYKNKKGFYVLPSYEKLYLIEVMNYERKKFKNFIKDIIESLNQTYSFDWILFDCPPNFTNLTYSVFNFVRHILVPCNPDIYAKKGLELLLFILERLMDKYEIKLNQNEQYHFYVFMNKAKLFQEHFTKETQRFYNNLLSFASTYHHPYFKINILKDYLPERVDIKRAMENLQFPKDYNNYFQSLCEAIEIGLE